MAERAERAGPSGMRSFAHALTCIALIALIFLCLAWETFLAPLRPGGSWLLLKAVLLLAPLFGILRERLYTYQWTSLLALGYFCEGAVRAWSDTGLSRRLAAAEIVLSLLLFAGCLLYAHSRRRAPA